MYQDNYIRIINSGVIREHVITVSFKTAESYLSKCVIQKKLSQKILRETYKMTTTLNHQIIKLLMCLNNLNHIAQL